MNNSEDIVKLHRNMRKALGVSATHLDWTMVPYVRKSFRKHYKTGIKYLLRDHLGTCLPYEEISIEDEGYKKNKSVYEYAMDMTVKEVYQAVEGMYHNLKLFGWHNGNIMNKAI